MNDPRQEILQRLQGVETRENVKVLYACESGSRAWGFASRNSDWDVRFIYVRPHDWYLSVDAERRRDVIELPIVDDLDINGWDIRKALWLLRKSNPPLLEWLHSPIVYSQQTAFAEHLRELLPTYYSFRACHYHYLSMAKSNYREYLQSDLVRLKKYLYVLRPLLAVTWMEQGRGRVPVEFDILLDCLHDEIVKGEIVALVERKIAGDELDREKRVDVLNQFIESELERLAGAEVPDSTKSDLKPLNALFRSSLAEAWGGEVGE